MNSRRRGEPGLSRDAGTWGFSTPHTRSEPSGFCSLSVSVPPTLLPSCLCPGLEECLSIFPGLCLTSPAIQPKDTHDPSRHKRYQGNVTILTSMWPESGLTDHPTDPRTGVERNEPLQAWAGGLLGGRWLILAEHLWVYCSSPGKRWWRQTYKLICIKWATRIYCTPQRIQSIFYNNYTWSITFKNCESLYCIPVTYMILYINYTSIKSERQMMKT